MTPLEIAQQVVLENLFIECANAGYGRVEVEAGTFRFEAFPGCEDAAADFIESIVDRKFS